LSTSPENTTALHAVIGYVNLYS